MSLQVHRLAFSYGRQTVLQNISFQAKPGQVMVILGPNGAGKSTLLHGLAGLLQPDRGQITLRGEDQGRLTPRNRARNVALVSQRPELPDTTVFDAVLMGRIPHFSWRPTQQDLQQTEDALEHVGIASLAGRRASTLSGGEQQLVAMARALAQDPKLLLCDEPTSNLDLHSQLMVCNLLRDLARNRRLVIIVTLHDVNLALRLADRILCIHDHAILADAPPSRITPSLIQDIYGVRADIIKAPNHQRIVIPCQPSYAHRPC